MISLLIYLTEGDEYFPSFLTILTKNIFHGRFHCDCNLKLAVTVIFFLWERVTISLVAIKISYMEEKPCGCMICLWLISKKINVNVTLLNV